MSSKRVFEVVWATLGEERRCRCVRTINGACESCVWLWVGRILCFLRNWSFLEK